MGNGQSSSTTTNPRFTSATRAFTQNELEDLKSKFDSLAAQSQSNGDFISPSVFKVYIGIEGPLGDRMYDLVTLQRNDHKLSFEDLVIAKGCYEKGTKDEIEEFIYKLADVTGDGILNRFILLKSESNPKILANDLLELLSYLCNFNVLADIQVSQSDLEIVLTAILECISSIKSPECGSGSKLESIQIFLNAAKFSKDKEGSESTMSFEDFRSWFTLLPSVRKFLGSLLMPSDLGSQMPRLVHQEVIDPNSVLLMEDYAWHIGGALSHQELSEWKLLYHSGVHGQSFNTFLGNISNGTGPTLLIIKDKEGHIYGGYASQPWEKHADFYGDMKSFLFQIYPTASIFRPTGANNNIQWCAISFSSESIPNGIGFGGRANHFGLFISANFDQGHTFSSPTFGNPCLSKTSHIFPEVIECWGIVAKGALEEKQDVVKGTVLERFKEDRNMLKMVGLANSSE